MKDQLGAYPGDVVGADDDQHLPRIHLLGTRISAGAGAATFQIKVGGDNVAFGEYNADDGTLLFGTVSNKEETTVRSKVSQSTRASWYVIGFAAVILALGLGMIAAGSSSPHGQRLAGMFTLLIGLVVLAYVPRTMLRVRR